MAIQTPLDIVNAALIRSGVLDGNGGETASANQINGAFTELNGIISMWNRKRWLCWAEQDIACTATGAQSYTIGTGQDFDVTRPDRLEAAYVRLLPVVNNQPYDRPLYVVESHEDYSRITLKNLTTYPTAIFYDTQFPVGNILAWPVPPSGQYELHIIIKSQITPFTTLTENIVDDVPPEYLMALVWNLAVYLAPQYQVALDPNTIAAAKTYLNTIRQANIQVPTLTQPYNYGRTGSRANGWYSWLTGGLG